MSKEAQMIKSEITQSPEGNKTPRSTFIGGGVLALLVGGLIYVGFTKGNDGPLRVDSRVVKTDAMRMAETIKSTPSSGNRAEAFIAANKDEFTDMAQKENAAAIDKVIVANDNKGFYELQLFTENGKPSGRLIEVNIQSRRLSDGAGFLGEITPVFENSKEEWDIDAQYMSGAEGQGLKPGHIVTEQEASVINRDIKQVLLNAATRESVMPLHPPSFLDDTYHDSK